jgi:hypothetical protein
MYGFDVYKAIRDWELESLVAFLDLLYSFENPLRETDKKCFGPQHVITCMK